MLDDIPLEKQHAILAKLQAQHRALVATRVPLAPPLLCTMVAAPTGSSGFTNTLFLSPKAYTSTPVLLSFSDKCVKSLVQLRRDSHGNLVDSVTLHGPRYKLFMQCDEANRQALEQHAVVSLFHVYCSVVYKLANKSTVPVLPPIPPLPDIVSSCKFDHAARVQGIVDVLSRAPSECESTSDMEVCKRVKLSEAQVSEDADENKCYICWESVHCDVLFPCGVASHACCMSCVEKLQQVWSSTTFDGQGTIKCPQCANHEGVLRRQDGSPIWVRSQRYPLRKQRKPQYRRTRILR